MVIREPRGGEVGEVLARLREAWAGETIVSRGVEHRLEALSILVALDEASWAGAGSLVGVASYVINAGECEVVTLDAFTPGHGVGTALLEAVAERARAAGCGRLWLITTNDNVRAQGFYSKRGWRLVAVHRGAVDEARALKPSIPLAGEGGVEIHDELEYELALQ